VIAVTAWLAAGLAALPGRRDTPPLSDAVMDRLTAQPVGFT
jgi:hypothetical protein